jgi:3-phosphoshikimate 1-carboxyvinyltransferase
MDSLRLEPIRSVQGVVDLPGSKSISNRVLLLASLAPEPTAIKNLLLSDDIQHMLDSLQGLGVSVTEDGRFGDGLGLQNCVVNNAIGDEYDAPVEMFLGNAGTAMRPLCAVLNAKKGEFTLTGEPRMYERPIGDLVDALRSLGATIEYLGDEGFPPLRIRGGSLSGGSVDMDCHLSSQFLSAFLLAAPLAKEDVNINIKGTLVSVPYIDITLAIMARFGVKVVHDNYQHFHIQSGQNYTSPGDIGIEPDASSASYFLAAAAIKGGTVRVNGLSRNALQGDVKFVDVLEAMGAKVTWGENFVEVTRGELNGVDLDLNHIPDAAMTIAVVALFAKGKTRIRNIYNWRVKETDRLAAMACELRKVGAEVEEGEDYIEVSAPTEFKEATIDTYNDHRMAMCFSLVALGPKAVIINDPACTSKTFPAYFEFFKTIC